MNSFLKNIKKRARKNSLLTKVHQNIMGIKPGENMWCRIVMDDATEQLIKGLNYSNLRALEISGNKWANFGFKSYRNVEFPDFDICKDSLNQTYDIIIAEQVFEHLKYPYKAGKNVYKHLKNDGYFLVTTPFMIKIHPSPEDCTRWSKTGMRFFLEELGFSESQSFSWGNKACVKANFNRWMPYNFKRHSLKNEPNFPLVVWALAQK